MLETLKQILEEVYKIDQNNEGYSDLTYEFNTDGIIHVKVYVDVENNFSTYFETDIDDDFILEDFINNIKNFIRR